VLTTAEDKRLRFWDAQTGRPFDRAFPVTDDVIGHAAFSPDGSRLLVTKRSGTARVWAADTFDPLSPEFPQQVSDQTQRYLYNYDSWPRVSADGKAVVTFKDKQVRFWSGGEPTVVDVPIFTIEVYFLGSPDRAVVTGANMSALVVGQIATFDPGLPGVRVWDVAGGDQLLSVPTPGVIGPGALWFAADGSRFGMIAGDGRSLTVPVPRFAVPAELAGPLVQFVTGQRLDENDGLEFVDQELFRRDVDTYRRAFAAWKK
jgi:WD40 repeat protein